MTDAFLPRRNKTAMVHCDSHVFSRLPASNDVFFLSLVSSLSPLCLLSPVSSLFLAASHNSLYHTWLEDTRQSLGFGSNKGWRANEVGIWKLEYLENRKL